MEYDGERSCLLFEEEPLVMNDKRHMPKASIHEMQSALTYTLPQTVLAYSEWQSFSGAEKEVLVPVFRCAKKVLDLGCGTGRAVTLLEDGIEYTGIDNSRPMIEAARHNHPDYEFINADIFDYLTKGETFDCALLLNNVIDLFHPLPRRQRLLSLICDGLISGGSLVLSSHVLQDGQTECGYYKEVYHNRTVVNYRSSHGSLINEIEGYGYCVIRSVLDFRDHLGDWVYVQAVKN